MEQITKDITIEDLVSLIPSSVNFLREKGIVCIICGEPVWGTLNELAQQKGISDFEIDKIVEDLNRLKSR